MEIVRSTVAEPIRDALPWLSFPNRTKKMLFINAINAVLDDISLGAYTPREDAKEKLDLLAAQIEDDRVLPEIEEQVIRESDTPDIAETDTDIPASEIPVNEDDIEEKIEEEVDEDDIPEDELLKDD